MFVKPTIDETTWEDLETALLTADFGPDITERIVDELREKVDRYRTTDPRDLQRMLKETLEEHFARFDTTLKLTERPAVVLVVGVNGVGKTTTIGKFANFLRRYQRSVVVDAKAVLDAYLDAVAATGGPGLIGGVLVGVMTAKAIAAVRGIAFIAVNHLEGQTQLAAELIEAVELGR